MNFELIHRVNNKRTVIARKFIFLENIVMLILLRMLPILFRYIEPLSRNYDLKRRLNKF